jgi:uncharacterized membrane protein HdeD (DUF308 family)
MLGRRTAAEEVARGVLLVLVGITVITTPPGFFTLALRIVGAVALVDGVLAFVGLFRERAGDEARQWTLALEGVAGVGAGVLVLSWPSTTAFFLLMTLGIWAFVTGAAELFSAVAETSTRAESILRVLRAVLGIAFGLVMLAHPAATAATLVIVVGCYALAMGLLQIAATVVAHRLPTT